MKLIDNCEKSIKQDKEALINIKKYGKNDPSFHEWLGYNSKAKSQYKSFEKWYKDNEHANMTLDDWHKDYKGKVKSNLTYTQSKLKEYKSRIKENKAMPVYRMTRGEAERRAIKRYGNPIFYTGSAASIAAGLAVGRPVSVGTIGTMGSAFVAQDVQSRKTEKYLKKEERKYGKVKY